VAENVLEIFVVDLDRFVKDFYEGQQVGRPSQLFEASTDTFYFVKDRQGRFVHINKLLRDYFGMASENEIIGKTDFEVLRYDLAEKYKVDDDGIMETGEPLRNKLELVGDGKGNIQWFLTTKVPLRNFNGDIVGIEGLTRDVRRTENSIEPYSEFRECIDFMQKNFMNNISIKNLSELSCMSLSTFERKFKKHFGCSPNQYIKRLRLEEACQLLNAGYNIQRVALDCGFCDQSYFTREFRMLMGETPRKYQLKHTNR
jgi:PAS domain S-box-containing protein